MDGDYPPTDQPTNQPTNQATDRPTDRPTNQPTSPLQTPAAVCATYAHPFEFVVGNLMGVALGPVLTNSHPYTAYGWFVLTLVSTCGSHSGYGFLGAEKHDEHHEFFDWNFGVGPVCDQLFGTSLPKVSRFFFSNFGVGPGL
mmetsp:Transcript_6735/g.12033  ORF Transcript_6735/g.12033 Transcript_6735/m.12033 type:complete len:142 (+) Transcript_6735:692-1117(+)